MFLHISLNLPVCCLQVVQADIFSADSLKPYFMGQDVIMSCLGFPASLFSGVTGYTLSMTAVVSAMRTARVSRLITMTSWYTERKHVQRRVLWGLGMYINCFMMVSFTKRKHVDQELCNS